MLNYRIITKDDYKRIRLNTLNKFFLDKNIVKIIEEDWNKMKGDYNFVIAIGQEGNEMFCSVDYFNDNVVSNKVDLGDYTVTLRCDDKTIKHMNDTLEFETRNNE